MARLQERLVRLEANRKADSERGQGVWIYYPDRGETAEHAAARARAAGVQGTIVLLPDNGSTYEY